MTQYITGSDCSDDGEGEDSDKYVEHEESYDSDVEGILAFSAVGTEGFREFSAKSNDIDIQRRYSNVDVAKVLAHNVTTMSAASTVLMVALVYLSWCSEDGKVAIAYAIALFSTFPLPFGIMFSFFFLDTEFRRGRKHMPSVIVTVMISILAPAVSVTSLKFLMMWDEEWLLNGAVLKLCVVTCTCVGFVTRLLIGRFGLMYSRNTQKTLIHRLRESAMFALWPVIGYFLVLVFLIACASLREWVAKQDGRMQRIVFICAVVSKAVLTFFTSQLFGCRANWHVVQQAKARDSSITSIYDCPEEDQNFFYSLYSVEQFVSAFTTSFALRMLVTSLRDWRGVFASSWFMNIAELIATGVIATIASCKIKRARNEDARKWAYVEAMMRAVAHMIVMSVEVIDTVVCSAAAIIFGASPVVTGFGNHGITEGLLIIIAWFVPELVCDFANIRLNLWFGFDVVDVYWRLQARLRLWIVIIVHCASPLAISVMAAVPRSL